MKKLAGLKRVLDGINQLNGSTQTDGATESEVNDSLAAENFTLAKVGRYGFPHHATCLALDPVQKLLAIGTANGSIRICGKPGVECHVHHVSNAAVNILLFLINEGGLVSVCNDASLHIWSLRQKQPALIQSLTFKRERITAVHSPFGSKWMYVGTERGNTYIVNVETFRVSGYVIAWNHVIDVSHKSHPGPVIQINSNPIDQNKLLLNFESGICVLWDLRSKKIWQSYVLDKATQYITSAAWNIEGKQFMTSHWDGSLSIWNYKNNKKPEERQTPHATLPNAGSKDKENICCPILKLEWLAGKVGELPLVIFSGGMPYGNKNKGLTIMRGRSKHLLLSDYIVDFSCLCSTPWPTEVPEPQALFVLLRNEIVVFDLVGPMTPSLPWFTLPYTFDIHESPITCVQFYPECPNDLLVTLHSLKTSQHSREQPNKSKRFWPLTGGQEGEINQDPTLMITGHADGTIKFWDATSSMLILCYRLSVSRLFERQVSRKSSINSNLSKSSSLEYFDDPFAIQHITLCPYGRVLAVACQSFFVAVFRFSTIENTIETSKIDVNFSTELAQECTESQTNLDAPVNCQAFANDLTHSVSQHRLSNIPPIYHPPLRTIGIKWPVGFQPEVVCQQLTYDPAPNIAVLTLSSAYGLVAFGNTLGVAIIDYVQKKSVMVIMSYDLNVPGEWTDSSSTPLPNPLTPSRSEPLAAVAGTHGKENDYIDSKERKKDPMEKRKERLSRMFSFTDHGHSKLSKKPSVHNTHNVNGKDHEDGLAAVLKDKREEPVAGSIHSLSFAYTYTRKSGNLVCPSLWVGTSLGSLAVIAFSVPSSCSQRPIQPVLSFVTGTLIDNRNCILNITHLDRSGNICYSPFDFWKDDVNGEVNRTNIQTINSESTTKQHICIATEKQIKVLTSPGFKVYAHVEPVLGDSFIVKADTMPIEDGNCISCLTTDGFLKIFSLPNLNCLLDVECGISLADYRMIRTFTLGRGGEAAFLTSPTEIQRVVFTKIKEEGFINDFGCMFTLCKTPEPRATGFFESFFSSSPSQLDREELFGPKSGNVTSNVATYVAGSGMESLRNQSDTVAGAMGRAKMALVERGEKLSALEDKTAEMNAKASNFSSAAKALADKYQRKKWYHL